MQRDKEQGFVYDLDSLIVEKAHEQGKISLLRGVGRVTKPKGNKKNREGVSENVSRSSAIRPDTFYHGTADNIYGFRALHPNRKDKRWLGRGIYFTDRAELAGYYSGFKGRNRSLGIDAKPNIIPVHLAFWGGEERRAMVAS